MTDACPVCASRDITKFLEIPRAPVFCNLLCRNREEARATPTGRIHLAHCAACDHVFNAAFQPEKLSYSPEYENSLHFSGQFQKYADSLADSLIERYGLREKTIIEIACGRGDFLHSLCERGANKGYGFDPSYPGTPDQQGQDPQVIIVPEFYDERYRSIAADFYCCRHALEHVAEPVSFLATLRKLIRPDRQPVIFFEVPNVLYTLRDGGIWDLIYEHCGYFSPRSFVTAFSESGFTTLEVSPTFDGQFLTLHARSTDTGHADLDSDSFEGAADYLTSFATLYESKMDTWRSRLTEIAEAGQTAVVWGAGSKGTTFLNTADSNETVEYVVDINPRKHGKFLAGTGQRIIPPEQLKAIRPSHIVILNPVYADEIRSTVSGLGLDCELLQA